jgi:hypothetical protein
MSHLGDKRNELFKKKKKKTATRTSKALCWREKARH